MDRSAMRAALELWLAYDEARRTLTARLFAERDSAVQIERLLDENERLRDQAVEITRTILSQS